MPVADVGSQESLLEPGPLGDVGSLQEAAGGGPHPARRFGEADPGVEAIGGLDLFQTGPQLGAVELGALKQR